MIFAIDFDGTIVEHKYPKIGDIKEFAKETIQALYDKGHKIIIWTCRSSEEDIIPVINFLKTNNIPYNKINENIDGIGFYPKPKIYADIYIDDRNIFVQSIVWREIYDELRKNRII